MHNVINNTSNMLDVPASVPDLMLLQHVGNACYKVLLTKPQPGAMLPELCMQIVPICCATAVAVVNTPMPACM